MTPTLPLHTLCIVGVTLLLRVNTLAALLAERLGWGCLDSGAIYRVMGLAAERRGLDLDDGEALAPLARTLPLTFDGRRVLLDGEDVGSLVRWIAHDAVIFGGNSGGPLVNTRGEVVAINTAINARGQNLGFAVPVNTVKRVVPTLIATGSYADPWLGIRGLSLNPMIAEGYDNKFNLF